MTDLTTALLDCLYDLRHTPDTTQRRALRIEAGLYILQMQEQFDDLDYAYALQLCELEDEKAEGYKQLYIASTRRKLKVQL